MNYIKEIQFFTPTSKLKELVILQSIENNENITQKELAEIVQGAASMINVYINDYEEKGYIVREYISAKTVKYKITPKGLHIRRFLSISYLHELMKLYQLAKGNVEIFLGNLENKEYKNILLYGAGEVAETILSVVRNRESFGVDIVGIVDDDSCKHNHELMGYRIISSGEIGEYEHDAIVITSYTYEDDIRRRLDEVGYGGIVERFFGE